MSLSEVVWIGRNAFELRYKITNLLEAGKEVPLDLVKEHNEISKVHKLEEVKR